MRADQLSGGQQRVAIAGALAQNARVILADEPVPNLDPESANTVLQSLRSAVGAGVAVVAGLNLVHLARAGRLVEDVPTARLDVRSIEQIYARASARSEP